MRIPPPGPLRLPSRKLVEAVKARLSQLGPFAGARIGDPTDPAWMLVLEAAWMVEQLSEQLDRYPAALLQQFAYTMGVELEPALPAVGVVVVGLKPGQEGALANSREADTTRFVAPATETRQPVTFVPAELGVPLRRADVVGWWALDAGRLREATEPVRGQLVTRRPALARAGAFDGATFRYRLVGEDAASLAVAVRAAAESMRKRRQVGWLEVAADPERGVVTATITPNRDLRRDANLDVVAPWGTLDGESWLPWVQLPPDEALRNATIEVRREGGTQRLVVKGVPESWPRPLDTLLELSPEPPPESVGRAIWRTLANEDATLPEAVPPFSLDLPKSPRWLAAVVGGGEWDDFAAEDAALVEIGLEAPLTAPGRLRVGFAGARVDELWHHPLRPTGAPWARERSTPAWSLPVPDEEGSLTVTALDVELPAGASGCLLRVPDGLRYLLLNPLLVLNAPRVDDGVTLEIRDLGTHRVELARQDLVTPAVIRRLAEGPLASAGLQGAKRASLGRVLVKSRGAPDRVVEDWAGLDRDVDASGGAVTIDLADSTGVVRNLALGDSVQIEWYRRTDGAVGVLPPGTVRHIEQSSLERTGVATVLQPFPTIGGRDRERAEAAVERSVGPSDGQLVLMEEFEDHFAREAGTGALGWRVRAWSHGERRLAQLACWEDLPVITGVRTDGWGLPAAEVRALRDAPPETLVISAGPIVGPLEREVFETVVAAARSWAVSLRRRYRSSWVREVRVVPARPLTLLVPEGDDAPVAERLGFFLERLPRGAVLRSLEGNERRARRSLALLDAQVVTVQPYATSRDGRGG